MPRLPSLGETVRIPEDLAASVFEKVRSAMTYGEPLPNELLSQTAHAAERALIASIEVSPEGDKARWMRAYLADPKINPEDCDFGVVRAIEDILAKAVLRHRARELFAALDRLPVEDRKDLHTDVPSFRNALHVCGDGALFWRVTEQLGNGWSAVEVEYSFSIVA